MAFGLVHTGGMGWDKHHHSALEILLWEGRGWCSLRTEMALCSYGSLSKCVRFTYTHRYLCKMPCQSAVTVMEIAIVGMVFFSASTQYYTVIYNIYRP